MTIWLPIDNYPGYEVSDAGQVQYRGRRLAQTPNDGGYLRVKLAGRNRLVHVLVLGTFVGPRPSPRHHGAHLHGKLDNRLTSLAWKLPHENEADKPVKSRGSRTWRPNRKRVEEIRQRAAEGESFTRLAREHGLHRTSVSRIVKGLRRAP